MHHACGRSLRGGLHAPSRHLALSKMAAVVPRQAGLHYALSACRPDASVVAFDVNDLANSVYEHNFGTRPQQVGALRCPAAPPSGQPVAALYNQGNRGSHSGQPRSAEGATAACTTPTHPIAPRCPTAVQTNISSLTAKRLDKWAADVWLLSPPCQPYTRRGLQKHSADVRATSFLGLLDLLPQLKVCVCVCGMQY